MDLSKEIPARWKTSERRCPRSAKGSSSVDDFMNKQRQLRTSSSNVRGSGGGQAVSTVFLVTSRSRVLIALATILFLELA